MTGWNVKRLPTLLSLLLSCSFVATAPTAAAEEKVLSWPRSGPLVDPRVHELEWVEDAGGTLHGIIVVKDPEEVPARDRRSRVVHLRVDVTGDFSSTTLLSFPERGAGAVHRATFVPGEAGDLLALSVYPTRRSRDDAAAASGVHRGVYLYRVERLHRNPAQALHDRPAAVLAVSEGFVERSWTVEERAGGGLLTFTAAINGDTESRIERRVLARDRLGAPPSSVDTLIRREEKILELSVIPAASGTDNATATDTDATEANASATDTAESSAAESNAAELLLWQERAGRKRRSYAARLGKSAESRVEIIYRGDAGLASLVPAGMSTEGMLGPGHKDMRRRYMEAGRIGDVLYIVSREITRQRSQLSNFYTALQLVRVPLDAPENAGSRTLVPPRSGALFSSFSLHEQNGSLLLSFLYERTGGTVESDLFLWREPERSGAINMTRTPRRVTAPAIAGTSPKGVDSNGSHVRLVWLQSQPGGYTPLRAQTAVPALQRRLPLYTQGNEAETASSIMVALPLAAVRAVYHVLISSAPALILILVLVTLLQQRRPELLRRRGGIVLAVGYILALVGYGVPPFSFAPLPTNAAPSLVVAVAAAVPVFLRYRARRRRALPGPGEMTAWIALALIAVASAPGVADIMRTFNNRGLLPLELGG